MTISPFPLASFGSASSAVADTVSTDRPASGVAGFPALLAAVAAPTESAAPGFVSFPTPTAGAPGGFAPTIDAAERGPESDAGPASIAEIPPATNIPAQPRPAPTLPAPTLAATATPAPFAAPVAPTDGAPDPQPPNADGPPLDADPSPQGDVAAALVPPATDTATRGAKPLTGRGDRRTAPNHGANQCRIAPDHVVEVGFTPAPADALPAAMRPVAAPDRLASEPAPEPARAAAPEAGEMPPPAEVSVAEVSALPAPPPTAATDRPTRLPDAAAGETVPNPAAGASTAVLDSSAPPAASPIAAAEAAVHLPPERRGGGPAAPAEGAPVEPMTPADQPAALPVGPSHGTPPGATRFADHLPARGDTHPRDPVVSAASAGRDTAVHILRQLGDGGRTEMVVRMDPAEFGRVEIRLAFDDAGSLHARFSADQPATLDIIRRDIEQLARTLADAGVGTEARNFRFDRNEQQGGQRQPFAEGAPRGPASEEDTPVPTAVRMAAAAGRIDLIA